MKKEETSYEKVREKILKTDWDYKEYLPEALSDVEHMPKWRKREMLISACEEGFLELAQYLYSLKSVKKCIDSDDCSKLLYRVCLNKDYEMGKWIYTCVGRRKRNLRNRIDPFYAACMYGDLETAKELYDENPCEIDALTFGIVCHYGEADMFEWIYALCGARYCDKESISLYAVCACSNNLGNVKIIFSGENSSYIDVDKCFMTAVCGGYMDIAKWLYDRGGIDIKDKHDVINAYGCPDTCTAVLHDRLNEIEQIKE